MTVLSTSHVCNPTQNIVSLNTATDANSSNGVPMSVAAEITDTLTFSASNDHHHCPTCILPHAMPIHYNVCRGQTQKGSFKQYGRSKLMNQMTCRELGKRLKVSNKLQQLIIVTNATPCDAESTGPVMA